MSEAQSLRARNLRTVAALAALFFAAAGARLLHVLRHRLASRGARQSWEPHHSAAAAPATRSAARAAGRIGWQSRSAATGRSSTSVTAPAMRTAGSALFVMRQTRLALNNDMTRVERVLLATGTCCAGRVLARRAAGSRRARCQRTCGRRAACSFPGGRARAFAVHRRPARQPDDELRCEQRSARPARGPAEAPAAVAHWLIACGDSADISSFPQARRDFACCSVRIG